ncbi:T9SS type A sorting domain-containing protein [Polaribacter sp. AHE13PA]|uniref:T9SS type A sorting domain-containing protein n=1 Tax=Polaribacter sp. AHE13PA TaxID=2745562 RepID=UPI001C4E3459|nr:T9SS type A sorting domain-containing protein [Polaribacter sp. AHE13PA]QXP66782.1 T9SS type A sorting domain-containing protein [Polaribacter sp. AHE13PA]
MKNKYLFVKGLIICNFLFFFITNIQAQTTPTNASSIKTGATFKWASDQTSTTDPINLESISIDGAEYNLFAVPSGYQLTKLGTAGQNQNSIRENGNVTITGSGATPNPFNGDYGSSAWNIKALAAFQDKNLNHYFTAYGNGAAICNDFNAEETTGAQRQSLLYSPAIPSNQGAIVAITERNGNNCFHIEVFGTPASGGTEQSLGETFVVTNNGAKWGYGGTGYGTGNNANLGDEGAIATPSADSDYWLTDRVLDNNGTLGIALFYLNEIAPTGSKITRVQMTAASSDHGDGKFFIVQSYATDSQEEIIWNQAFLNGDVTTNNQVPDGSTYSNIGSGPSNGTLEFNADGTYIYTPNENFVGVDTFEYQVCLPAPNTTTCDTATVTITVRRDSDGDGVPDYLDLDSDNDGILDTIESGGNDPFGDEDNDGVFNYQDNEDNGNSGPGGTTDYTDTNNDGIPDVYDFDEDGIPNHLDLDSDNDGITDVIEAGGTDSNNDGLADGNVNEDGIPSSAGLGLTPTNSDSDDLPNFLDLDSDNDGLYDLLEAGGTDADNNGIADDLTDSDNDGLADIYDGNCMSESSYALDAVSTGTSKPYFNNETNAIGVPSNSYAESTQNAFLVLNFGKTLPANTTITIHAAVNNYNQDVGVRQADSADGTGLNNYVNISVVGTTSATYTYTTNASTNYILIEPYNPGVLIYGAEYSSSSTDCSGTALIPTETSPGTPDYINKDSDGDGCSDVKEAGFTDADNDGEIDGTGISTSGTVLGSDGYSGTTSAVTDSSDSATCLDTDGDGVPDYLDLDSDNDGIPDSVEYSDSANCFEGSVSGINEIALTPYATATNLESQLPLQGLSNGAFNVDVDFNGLAKFSSNGIQINTNNAIGEHIYFQPIQTSSISTGNYATITITFPKPVSGLSFDVAGLNNHDYYEMNASYNGSPITVDNSNFSNFNPTNFNNSNGWQFVKSNQIVGRQSGGGTAVTENTFTFSVDGLVDTITIRTGKDQTYQDSQNSNVTSAITSMNFCPLTDTDGDGIPDYLDLDSDNDGIPDIVEAGGIDTNGDGLIDYPTAGDPTSMVDLDGDGLADMYDDTDTAGGTPNWVAGTPISNPDSDGDGIKDYLDLDSDNDGIPDLVEAGGIDTNGDGRVDDITDLDQDGLADIYDENASNGPGASGTNGTALIKTDAAGNMISGDDTSIDTDGDGIADHLDLDSDNDGITDLIEAGGTDTNGDGRVDTNLDADKDGLADIYDENAADGPRLDGTNGTALVETDADGNMVSGDGSSIDTDSDGIPDHLDLDADNDGIPDIIEAGGIDANGDGHVDTNLDADKDGLADIYDENASDGPGTDGTNGIALIKTGLDGNTIGRNGESIDTDSDGIPDHLDLDSDNDGIPDIVEAGGVDTNGDGKVDDIDPTTSQLLNDLDRDGLDDLYDVNSGTNTNAITYPDSDNDGIPDTKDLDSDNDGITDVIEAGGLDTNRDGIADSFVDTDNDGFNDLIDGDVGQDGTSENINNVLIITGIDTNADGKPNSYPSKDYDGDGKLNHIDIDADNDGIPDNIEAQTTSGYIAPSNPNGAMLDANKNGVDDNYEVSGIGLIPVNTDNKDNQDYLDLDSDNDGIPDISENGDTANNVIIDINADEDGDGLNDIFDDNNDAENSRTTVNDGSSTLKEVTTSSDLDTAFGDEDNDFPGNGDLDYRDIKDTDNDGVPDFYDLDDDNDGILDTDEGCGNLIINGDFELQDFSSTTEFPNGGTGPYGTFIGKTLNTNTLTGWNYSQNLDGWVGGQSPSWITSNFAAAYSGNQYVDVLGNNDKSDGGVSNILSQTISTVPGNTYTLSFYWGEDIGHETGQDVTLNVKVKDASSSNILDKTLTTIAEGAVNGVVGPKKWYRFTTVFVATTTETSLEFQASPPVPGSIGIGAALDLVSIFSNNCEDTDNDGIPNSLDLDSDNDGIPDLIEAGGEDTDGNGLVDDINADNTLINDANNNGLDDRYDADITGGNNLENLDTDGDGIPNSIDLDSDNDGIVDIIEAGGTDANRDGKVDTINADGTLTTDTNNNGFDDAVDGSIDVNTPLVITGEDTDGNGKPNTYTKGDKDNDSIPNFLDIDADNDGIPDNVEAQTTNEYNAPSGIATGITDTNNNGVDDTYEDGNNIGLIPENTDGTDNPDYLDLDSDNDNIPDISENGHQLDVASGNDDDNDGLDNAFDDNDDSAIAGSTVNDGLGDGNKVTNIGTSDTSLEDAFGDEDNDVNTGGNLDYRDIPEVANVMITQVYHLGSEKWIEITNIGTSTILPNSVKIHLFKDKTGDQTNIDPDASYILTTPLLAGKSVLFRNSNNTFTPESESVTGRTIVDNDALTDLDDTFNDIIILSASNGVYAWDHRYDVVSNVTNNTSVVRIDESLTTNKDYNAEEWVVFIDDAISTYEIVGEKDVTGTKRHPQDPLISEIITSDKEANTLLGLHRVNITTSTADNNVYTNGYPDRSRSVVIDQNFEHTENRLSARELKVDANQKLTVTDQLLVVTNDITLDGDIRLAGTKAQLVQTHSGESTIKSTFASSMGKLLVDQNSEIPSLYRYGYMSSPVNSLGTTYTVQDVLKDGTDPANPKDITFVSGYDGSFTTTGISLADYWIYTYVPGSDGRSNWVHKYKSGTINRGEGYIFKGPGREQNYTFSGTPNDGDFNTDSKIAGGESYLIGNPYPSAINTKKFIKDNLANTTGTLYFWEHHESVLGEGDGIAGHVFGGYIGGYATINFVTGVAADKIEDLSINDDNGTSGLGDQTYKEPKAYIAMGQGFFIEGDAVIATPQAVNFNNSQRAYVTEGDQSVFFKTSKKSSKTASTTNLLPIIKLGFEYKNTDETLLHHQIAVSFQGTNSFDFDKGYDSHVYQVGNTDIYWKFPNDDSNYVIAGVQAISNELEVPLELVMDYSGQVNLMVDEIQNVSRDIYITDKLTGTSYDVKNEKITLTLEKGVYPDRFVLAFSPNTALNVEDEILASNTNIYADNENKQIVISISNEVEINKVELFDILGKKVSVWNIKEQKDTYQLDIKKQIPTGIYIVKMNTSKGETNKKVIIE